MAWTKSTKIDEVMVPCVFINHPDTLSKGVAWAQFNVAFYSRKYKMRKKIVRTRRKSLCNGSCLISQCESLMPLLNEKNTIIHYLFKLSWYAYFLWIQIYEIYHYVNSRPWPESCVIRNPLNPPPIAQEIDIHVIDLVTLNELGTMLRAHKANTPNHECFFIFLDVWFHFCSSTSSNEVYLKMEKKITDEYYQTSTEENKPIFFASPIQFLLSATLKLRRIYVMNNLTTIYYQVSNEPKN